MCQGCWFDPQSGHMQEATGERMDSGTISHSLSQKKKKKGFLLCSLHAGCILVKEMEGEEELAPKG